MGIARAYLALLLLLPAWGCGDDVIVEALLLKTTPANGATAVSLTLQPSFTFGAGVSLDATPPRVVMYDVTAGGKAAVGATVEVDGQTLTYKPDADLTPLHRYVLEVRQGAVGGDFLLTDASDKPEEKLQWKRTWWETRDKAAEGVFSLRFDTLSHPRVIGAYQAEGKLHVHFSQPMDRSSCQGRIHLLESISGKTVKVTRMVWPSASRAYLELGATLQSSTVYTLKVETRALGADLTYLDGNDNGKAGEKDDDFCVKFTGFQTTIVSRLGASNRVPCSS